MVFKKFLSALILLISLNTYAGKIGIDIGSGLRSNYGAAGLGFRYFPNKHLDLFYNVGADIVGGISTYGLRVYTSPMGNRCFFIIPCVPLMYFGVHAGHTSGGIVTAESNGVETDYEFDRGNFAGANVGFFDLYGGWFFTNIDIGYRSFYNVPEYTVETGISNQDSEETFDEYLKPGLSAGLSLGVLF